VLAVFLLSGLWHGAGWTFVIWGGLHGFYLVCGRLTMPLRQRLWAAMGVSDKTSALRRVGGALVTFHLVTFAWIFFRSADLGAALTVVRRIAAFDTDLGVFGAVELWSAGALVAVLAAAHWLQSRPGGRVGRFPAAVRWAAYAALALAALNLRPAFQAPFMYMQF